MIDLGKFFMYNWTEIIITVLLSYLIGSLNFSIIISKFISKGEDIRTKGSGNAGFTNMLRTSGKKSAIATLILDFLKGVAATWIGGQIFLFALGLAPENMVNIENEAVAIGRYLAGFFCILGHMYPVYFGFKGGKGIATTAGLALVIDWRVFLVSIGLFIVLVIITKIVSLSSICAACMFALSTFLFTFFADYRPSLTQEYPYNFSYVIVTTVCACGIAALLIIKHKENIKRLVAGEEHKFSSKK